jgi:hypothetical protein
MAQDFEIFVDPDGTIEHVYSDDLADLLTGEGEVEVTRASHVEPSPRGHGWLADMRPLGGPIIGADGAVVCGTSADDTLIGMLAVEAFPTRQAALDAETAWIHDELMQRKVTA